jgi:hypothetical protein
MTGLMRFSWDEYRVLPHRNVLDCGMYGADGRALSLDFEHVPCGMPLTQSHIEDNWCPHCADTLNRAAKKRAITARGA